MANDGKATKPTTRTTVTKSGKGPTVRTTTTKSTYNPGPPKPAPVKKTPIRRTVNTTTNTYVTKTSNNGSIIGIILLLILLVIIAYLLMNPTIVQNIFSPYGGTPAQQSAQFNGQLAAMQGNIGSLSAFYLNNAGTYNLPVNQSWTVQITDQDYAGGPIIGQLTISWSGLTKQLSIEQGIVNTGYSPTYAVTLTHYQFMTYSNAVINEDVVAGAGYYSADFLSGKIKYTQVN